MIEFLGFISALALLAAALLIPYRRAQAQRVRIIEHLAALGASNIRVRLRIFDLDETNLTYDVSYRDGAGRHHSTVCKVVGDWWNEQHLDWDEVPQRAVAVQKKPRRHALAPAGGALTDRDEIEQFMRDLIAENARLRARLQESNPAR